MDVYMPVQKKVGHWLRFAFVRYDSDQDAWQAIRMFNGLKQEGAYLEVKKVKYEINDKSGRIYQQGKGPKMNYVVQGKVWKPEMNVTQTQPDPQEGNTNATYNMDDAEKVWIERSACATLYSVREGLHMHGLHSVTVELLGARDVLLEFESTADMMFILSEAESLLDEMFEWIKPCSIFMTGKCFLVWLRVWKVPLGAWNTNIFTGVAGMFGNFVCIDGKTS